MSRDHRKRAPRHRELCLLRQAVAGRAVRWVMCNAKMCFIGLSGPWPYQFQHRTTVVSGRHNAGDAS